MANISSEAAFEEFFRNEYARLARGISLVTRDRQEAEDLAQEAMARVYERWDRVRSMDSPVGYAFTTAMNLHRNRLRALAVRTRKTFAVSSDLDPVETVTDRAAVQAALGRLPRDQRAAVLLVDWFGLSAAEAAPLLGVQAVSVRSRVHRARAALRMHLADA